MTGVFQTLSCGNAGQRVPGRMGPDGVTGGDSDVVVVLSTVEVVVEEAASVVVVESDTDVAVDAVDDDLVAISGVLLAADVDVVA